MANRPAAPVSLAAHAKPGTLLLEVDDLDALVIERRASATQRRAAGVGRDSDEHGTLTRSSPSATSRAGLLQQPLTRLSLLSCMIAASLRILPRGFDG